MMTRADVQLSFYSSFHSNVYNKAIHLICIPLISWWVRDLSFKGLAE